MANSIKPVALTSGELLRLDKGFLWSHDFQWRHLDTNVDLSNWTISAEFWYRNGFGAGFGNVTNQGLAIAAADVAYEATAEADGKFQLSVAGSVSEPIADNFRAPNLSLLITATNTADVLGYTADDKALIATDQIPLYSNANSANSASTGLASLVVIETGAGTSSTSAVSQQDTVINQYADLPDPTTIPSGVVFRITNDPNFSGQHMAIGPVGSNATHYQQI